MTEKAASILWDGAGKDGVGKISTQSGALMDYPYGFASRFGDNRRGTNPEELLGAAHAACFTMAFSFAQTPDLSLLGLNACAESIGLENS